MTTNGSIATSDDGVHTNLSGSLKHLDWRHIAAAVLDVFRENEANEKKDTAATKARADTWSICSQHRRRIHDRARCLWMRDTGLGEEWWPYSEDYVARLYFRFRKRSEVELQGFNNEIAGFFGG